MTLAMLPLLVTVAATTTPSSEPPDATRARIAQVQLADTLAAADSIDGVTARGHVFTFRLDLAGEAVVLTATTDRTGEVRTVSTARPAQEPGDAEAGPLTWLATELGDAVAVTMLSATSGSAISLTTADNRTYLTRHVRLPTGNTGAEARWAAAWSP